MYFVVKSVVPAFALSLLIVMGAFSKKNLSKIRERLDSPRTGYVKFEKTRSEAARFWRFAIGAIIFAIVFSVYVGLSARSHISFDAPLFLLFGIMLATVGLFFVAYKLEITRFYFSGTISLLLGILLVIYFSVNWNFDINKIACIVYFIGMGLAGLLLGLFTLRRYLRDYPPMGQSYE